MEEPPAMPGASAVFSKTETTETGTRCRASTWGTPPRARRADGATSTHGRYPPTVKRWCDITSGRHQGTGSNIDTRGDTRRGGARKRPCEPLQIVWRWIVPRHRKTPPRGCNWPQSPRDGVQDTRHPFCTVRPPASTSRDYPAKPVWSSFCEMGTRHGTGSRGTRALAPTWGTRGSVPPRRWAPPGDTAATGTARRWCDITTGDI